MLSNWTDEQGPALIAALRQCRPNLPIIVLADGGSIALAVDAMRAGASDYLAKPIAPERLIEALASHADRRRASGELAPLSEKIAPELSLDQLVGAAPDFRSALAVAAKGARNRLPILIVGEAGTARRPSPGPSITPACAHAGQLVQVDCKAVAANIIDSELFGHVPGAFPGAFCRARRSDGRSRRRNTAARRDRCTCPRKPRNGSTACSLPAKCARSAATAQIRSISG